MIQESKFYNYNEISTDIFHKPGKSEIPREVLLWNVNKASHSLKKRAAVFKNEYLAMILPESTYMKEKGLYHEFNLPQ